MTTGNGLANLIKESSKMYAEIFDLMYQFITLRTETISKHFRIMNNQQDQDVTPLFKLVAIYACLLQIYMN